MNQVIQVNNLYHRYGKVVAIQNVDFTVGSGEIFGLIGPDGAGKTSTFHILAGVMAATSGEVRVLGKPPREARLSIGYLTQQMSLYLDLSVEENLRYSAGLRRVPRFEFLQRRSHYLRLMGLEDFYDRLAGQLSGGMKQKLALCCALISEPKVLLLDEPTTGVDPISRREFWDILATVASQGVTIVVATPYLDEAERCHRIALMSAGTIQEIGTLSQLRQHLGLHRLEVRLATSSQGIGVMLAAEQALSSTLRLRSGFTLQNSVSQNSASQNSASTQNQIQSVIVDVQTFGDRLDVLVKDESLGREQVNQILSSKKIIIAEMQAMEATLENIFVNHLRATGKEPKFIPFPRDSPPSANLNRPAQPLGTGVDQSGGVNAQLEPKIAIEAQSLRKVFGDFVAVKQVDLTIHYGEVYGLLGANGAGKTTTIKMLCGLLEPSRGRMSLAGQRHNLRSRAVRQKLGYMSQRFTLYDDLTIQQNLEFYCGVYQVPRSQRPQKINWVLTICGLLGQEHLLTGQLPGGWKQRVAFGASVMHEPEILFLDEPTSGVDPLARRQFWRLINDFAQQGTAILVTTHYLEEAEQCHRLGFMVAGEVVAQGSPTEIKAAQPGQLMELVVTQPQVASNLLKQHLDPWRISIFGDRLHLILDSPDGDLAQIQALLKTAKIPINSCRPIPFSLEDAFISIVQRAQQ
ncbi:MAG: ABC transporter ATP-binding protein [Coleofasciculaceae cyanobacterium SM2_1_6]|nr:ABC transporter ATP-binding protein [Coleofasciculaceae cyanobacterium SM2_1_6]